MSSSFSERFREFLVSRFKLVGECAKAPLTETMVSSYRVQLAREVEKKITQFIADFDEFAKSEDYLKAVTDQSAPTDRTLLEYNPGNRAILNSFDFHIVEGKSPKLIEINTNASFGLMGDALYDFCEIPHPDFRLLLQKDIQNAHKEWMGQSNFTGPRDPTIGIVDEHPQQQKLFIEFLCYQNLFREWGWQAEICDTADLILREGRLQTKSRLNLDFVYNRDTDFRLETARARVLREAYLRGLVCLSPHPREYLLMAEKSRLIALSQSTQAHGAAVQRPELMARLAPFILATRDVSHFADRNQLWRERKGYIFKPKSSYAGKAVYRGSSISRRTFEAVVDDHFIAQEYAPAPEAQVEEALPGARQTKGASEAVLPFRYDVRAYAYAGQYRFSIARLYRGQVTNFNALGGGFATIDFQ